MGSALAGRGGECAAAGDFDPGGMPMDLHWLKPLLGRPSPFTTVYLDATRTGANADAEAADRWRAVRRSLERDGASAGVLDDIAELVSVPTGVRGPHGRVVVADAQGVVVDRGLGDVYKRQAPGSGGRPSSGLPPRRRRWRLSSSRPGRRS